MDVLPALNIIEHNYEGTTEVVSVQNHPNGQTYPVSYTPTIDQIVALIEVSSSCCQYLRYDCHGSMLGEWGSIIDHWRDRHGDWKSYFPGGPPDGTGCACNINRTCDGGYRT